MNIARRGKIARLPEAIREELNRRMKEGWPGRKLVAWLNTLPEVQAAVAAEWNGQSIREPNLTKWKQGGYRDWLIREETRAVAAHLGRSTESLRPGEDQRPLSDTLALWLTAHYALAGRQIVAANDGGATNLRLLRELCRELVPLRRGDHSAERLRLGRERMDFHRARQEHEAAVIESAKQASDLPIQANSP